MSKITKKDFANFIKKQHSTSNDDASKVVDAFFETVVNMAKNGGVTLKNFGSFNFVEKTMQRKIYNFQTKAMEEKTVEISKICFLKSRNLKL
jgi:nucleoid DNA-binding protein